MQIFTLRIILYRALNMSLIVHGIAWSCMHMVVSFLYNVAIYFIIYLIWHLTDNPKQQIHCLTFTSDNLCWHYAAGRAKYSHTVTPPPPPPPPPVNVKPWAPLRDQGRPIEIMSCDCPETTRKNLRKLTIIWKELSILPNQTDAKQAMGVSNESVY